MLTLEERQGEVRILDYYRSTSCRVSIARGGRVTKSRDAFDLMRWHRLYTVRQELFNPVRHALDPLFSITNPHPSTKFLLNVFVWFTPAFPILH